MLGVKKVWNSFEIIICFVFVVEFLFCNFCFMNLEGEVSLNWKDKGYVRMSFFFYFLKIDFVLVIVFISYVIWDNLIFVDFGFFIYIMGIIEVLMIL